MQLTHTESQYHMDHHGGHTIYGAFSHEQLGAMAEPSPDLQLRHPLTSDMLSEYSSRWTPLSTRTYCFA